MGASCLSCGATRGALQEVTSCEKEAGRQTSEKESSFDRPPKQPLFARAPGRVVARTKLSRVERGNRSGDLKLGFGGVFGIGFADDAVSAVSLGGIKAGVGALDQ